MTSECNVQPRFFAIFQNQFMLRWLFILILSLLTFNSCKKDRLDMNCQLLKQAIIEDNRDKANEAITLFIENLSSKMHTTENLQMLVASISGQCSMTSEVICFKCIQTLPEQSEIKILIAGSLQKIIDISESADGKMKFLNMHQ